MKKCSLDKCTSLEEKINKVYSVFYHDIYQKYSNLLKFNLDFILLSFFKNNHFHFYYDDIFDTENATRILSNLDELLTIINKSIEELPLVQHTFHHLFEIEKKFILEKNPVYLRLLERTEQPFSSFYPYYSQIEKKELFDLLYKNNGDILNKDISEIII